jgi:four helix bundle protein
MKQLESLDAWRVAQELAHRAYILTLSPVLRGHFALLDQIRRAGISIPANIAEGYALGTTPQFIRCLRIALGSTSELRSHLSLLQRLRLIPDAELRDAIDLSGRTIAMLVGLLRKLNRHGRVPCPVSRVPD